MSFVSTATEQPVMHQTDDVSSFCWHPRDDAVAFVQREQKVLRGCCLITGTTLFSCSLLERGHFGVMQWAPDARTLVWKGGSCYTAMSIKSQHLVKVRCDIDGCYGNIIKAECAPFSGLVAASIQADDHARDTRLSQARVYDGTRVCYQTAVMSIPNAPNSTFSAWAVAWSPNGKWAAFLQPAVAGPQAMHIVTAATWQVVTTVHVSSMQGRIWWCPDGCSILVAHSMEVRIVSFLLNLNGIH